MKYNGEEPYNWPTAGEYEEQPVSVGSYQPNPWGLYDMHGNVWEWFRDWFSYEHPGGINPEVLTEATHRGIRGGSCHYEGWECRSAARYWLTPDGRLNDVGFRVALVQTVTH